MRRLYSGRIFHLVRHREGHHIPSTVIGVTMRNEAPKLCVRHLSCLKINPSAAEVNRGIGINAALLVHPSSLRREQSIWRQCRSA
jgi:hypothetical protein